MMFLNLHDSRSLAPTLCDGGLYCYYTGLKHLPIDERKDVPAAFVKCVVDRVSQGILKKGMCDIYKYCV